jgi:glycosyltransferase involved in cell wall biosynthesis
MDWLPNIDGMRFFVHEVLPSIRQRRPECTLSIVGRTPTEEVIALGRNDPRITVTGTVPDVRPYLWGSRIAVVPLRIGGGTRLKIYEAMAAGIPVVSTTVGAEGLFYRNGQDIRIADTAQDFAEQCLALLENSDVHHAQAAAALELVHTHFGWPQVAKHFEAILENASTGHVTPARR